MKTKLYNWKNRQIKLIMVEKGLKPDDCAALAVATLHEGLGVWNIEDVRLTQYGQASPYFCVGADQYWASYTAPDIEKAKIARSLIKEEFPRKEGASELKIDYCTFDGHVRGKTPTEMGVETHVRNQSPLLHTMAEAKEYLNNLVKFWDAQPFNANDPDARGKASEVKIENPWRQVRDLMMTMNLMEYEKERLLTTKSSVAEKKPSKDLSM